MAGVYEVRLLVYGSSSNSNPKGLKRLQQDIGDTMSWKVIKISARVITCHRICRSAPFFSSYIPAPTETRIRNPNSDLKL